MVADRRGRNKLEHHVVHAAGLGDEGEGVSPRSDRRPSRALLLPNAELTTYLVAEHVVSLACCAFASDGGAGGVAG